MKSFLSLAAFMSAASAAGALPALLPRDQEITLALSAAPPHLRAAAAVYVLESTGYVLARKGSNNFTCLVHRDHPRSSKPTCWDQEGAETILPAVLREGELLMQGKPVAEIRAEINRGFAEGKFIAPRRPGVAYMLSNANLNYTPRGDSVQVFPAHVMFYAPNLTDADIGSKGDGAGGLPFIAYQGPHGYMITVPEAPAAVNQPAATSEPARQFSIDQLRGQREKSGKPYLPFLDLPSMRMGVYALAAGGEDKQTPHEEDETYYVLTGRAVLRVGSQDHPVGPGSIVFVAAHAEHKFHSIAEPLEVLVFFAAGGGHH